MKKTASTSKTKENKTESITFRLTEQQKQHFEKKAAEMGIGLSACVSHALSNYENMKQESQLASAKSIELMTQKQILEDALQKARQDSHVVANPAFTEFFASVVGKELNGKPIKSKYDLLGVMASRADVKLVEDKLDLHIPLEVKNPVPEKGVNGFALWQIALGALFICALVAVIAYSLRSGEVMRG